MPRSSSAEMSANTAVDAVPGTAVREQLARIVDSPNFISSARLCRFLTHIVNRTGSYVPIFRWLDPHPQSPRQEIGTAFQAAASVAVLPFVNMSPEPEQGYFCDGISEEIINSLTRIAGLKVIARSSAFQFKGISVDIREVGRRLDADVIIEGSVRKAGEKLRITAQAIEAESGHDLWSEVFRRELKDVFAIQEEIAQSVAGLLRVHLPVARARVHPSVGDLEAYTRYLRARFLIHQQSPEALRAALEQLRELTHVFPDYALAYRVSGRSG